MCRSKRQHFLFGTDSNGRDLLTRTLIAGRVSLAIGLLATTVAILIGVLYGATSGYLGGRVDLVMMRIVDILYSLPFIFFVILLVVFFGRNFVLMFIAVGAVEWLDMARIVRGQTLSIKRQEYVQAAEAMGVAHERHPPPPRHPQHARPGRRLHDAARAEGDPAGELPVLPRPRRAGADDQLGRADLGGRQEHPGRDLDAGLSVDVPRPTTLFCLNFIGDGLRDALDPKDR